MSGVEQEVKRRVRRFSEEFKRDAVRLVVEEGYTLKAAATVADYLPPDSAIRWAAMNFSFSVTPRPGRSGTEIQPSTAWTGSFVS